jgi:hypothetical protein
MPKTPKYNPENLISMFRLAAELRERMVEAGFTDNGGAIHSAERILHLLGLRVCFPGLSHINNLRKHPNAPFSKAAQLAYQAGAKVLIEHVNPHRALTRLAIETIESGVDDAGFVEFVRENYQLALLTEEETTRLNKKNRTKMEQNRLASVGITLAQLGAKITNNPGSAEQSAA